MKIYRGKQLRGPVRRIQYFATLWEQALNSRFLSDGEKHNAFYCPFCDIKLAACLIYTEGELSKSPHFSARWEDHRFGCDGEPVAVDDPEHKLPKAHYKPRLMHLPEELTNRPPARVIRPKGPAPAVACRGDAGDVSVGTPDLGEAIANFEGFGCVTEIPRAASAEKYLGGSVCH